MLHQLSDHLRASRETVIRRWMKAVREDAKIPSADGLNDDGLRDHLDVLLERLGQELSKAATGCNSEPEAHKEAWEHGGTRWRQQYQIEELLQEIAVLRSEFLEFFSEYLHELRQIETAELLKTTRLVHRFFDSICIDSVSYFARQREQQTENTQRALQLMNEALEKANQQYQSADLARRRTLRTVVHEMSNPLNALGLGVSYLAESEAVAERVEARQHISRTLDHLRSMLEQLLDFSRVDGQAEPLHVSEFSIRPLFDYLTSGFRSSAAEKGLAFRTNLDPQLRSVIGDEGKVQRIAVNLLSNAIKYCDSGHVGLSVERVDDTHWAIQVTDTGCGIPSDQLGSVFSEFHRLARHSNKPGLGLGLTIVRSLVDRLGGTVTLQSVVGGGSTFRVVLPRVIAAPQALTS